MCELGGRRRILRTRDGVSKVHHVVVATGCAMDGSEGPTGSLAEVAAQSGRTVVHSELDEGVQEVPVQIGELFA